MRKSFLVGQYWGNLCFFDKETALFFSLLFLLPFSEGVKPIAAAAIYDNVLYIQGKSQGRWQEVDSNLTKSLNQCLKPPNLIFLII